METMRRDERPLPPPLPRPVHRQREQHAEEDFEATIGNLVRYYATLPPGALEANVHEQAAPAFGVDAHSTQEVCVAPRRRTWAWVLGGAGSMLLGGVVTFALIVGRPDFWRVADRPAPAPAKIALADSTPQKAVRGIPKAVPLADTVEEALSEAAAPAVKAAAETAAVASPAVANKVVENKMVEVKAQVTATPARAVQRRPARATASTTGVKARRTPRRSSAATAAPPAPAAERPTRRGSDEWEDPYE